MAPPKPRLVLRVGVTGHRPNRFSDAAQCRVFEALQTVFAGLQAAAMRLRTKEEAVFSSADPELRIVSALAEGADRVAARAGLKAGYKLDVILPFPAECYEEDFVAEPSRTEFRELLDQARACFTLPGERSGSDPQIANRAYESAGLMTLRHCDLVIAIWDGKESAGRGGTEDIVQRAISSGRPVLRFDQDGNGPYLLDDPSLNPQDARDLAAAAAQKPAADDAQLAALVERLCAPPRADADKDSRAHLLRFLKERERRIILAAPWYPLLLSLFSDKTGFWKSFRQARYLECAASDWQPYWLALSAAGEAVSTPTRDIVMTRFAWADGLANHYGQLHRSGYVSNYILAAMAVLCAAAAVAYHSKISGEWPQALEFFVIIAIGVTTVRGLWHRWHQRWLNYRLLSAQLRHLRALVLTGSGTTDIRPAHGGDTASAGAHWVGWYCSMTAREIGVLNATADRGYVDAVRAAIRDGELAGQQIYHHTNARRMHAIACWLNRLSHLAFAATAIICTTELFAHADLPHAEIFGLLTIVLPAVGAALFGISVHGDFEGSAERSANMEHRLSMVIERLGGDRPMTFPELSALGEYAVLVMASELGDWNFVFRARPLTLPA